MTDITIPPEALEAAARAVHDIDRKIAGEDQWPAWEDISPTDQRRRLHRALAACLAMLKAWPGMSLVDRYAGDLDNDPSHRRRRMLKPEQIPDEVVDAAVAMRDRGGSMSDIIRTAINAWPGMDTRPNIYGRQDAILILPLPKEPKA